MNLCTIIAKNYVAYARVLARSLVEHDPQARLWTLIIDDFSGYIDPAEEPFEVLTPKDIGCQPFEQMAVRYTVLELSTAVKPWLLRHLLDETGGPVTYLDPDIRAYGSLRRLDELAAGHGVVLIPHNSQPIPFDGRKPSQIDIMIAGVYNLGYISLDARDEVDRLLDWWADRLRRDCRVDPTYGYFVDQRWFDLMPGFLTDVGIVRDPEYNVAYWNLHSRKVEYADGTYLVDGRPLAFFHFSGFDPQRPLVLSRYQDRVEPHADPVLERLLAEYAAEVMDAGHALTRSWPYGYAALGDGTPLSDDLRRLYDAFLEEKGEDVPSALTPEGGKLYLDWLCEPAPNGPPGISRALVHVYEDRDDLREAYPDLTGTDGARLLRWAEEHGTREIPLLRQLLGGDEAKRLSETAAACGATVESAAGALLAPLRNAPWGVNMVGYFRSELGVAEVARQMVSALDARNVPVLPVHGRTVPRSRQGHSYVTVSPDQALFAINLICMNADVLPEFAKQVREDFFAGRYSIGLWFWEVSRFPEYWRDSFSLVEEIWAPSAHIADALEPLATVPVTTVRIPVQPPPIAPLSRADLGLPDGRFLFLFSFDYLSEFKRKNPLSVVEAFRRAFSPGEGAKLILKCINAERDPDNHARLRSSVAEHPDIEIIDRYLSPLENNTLTALCDCYASLHRAEGLGLVMAEAMALGKPVIATGYSGNLDFMTQSNSLLVRHRLVPIGPAAGPYPEDGDWADPDVEHASTLMREVFDDPDAARELGARAAEDIRRTHSPEAVGGILRRRLEEIWATGRTRRSAESEQEPSIALDALARMEQLPSPGDQPVRGSPRKLARNVMLRLMRPFTTYQQTVNREVVSVLEAFATRSAPLGLASLDDQTAHVQLLRELRGYEYLKVLPSFVEFHGSTIDQIKRDLWALGERVGGPGHITDRTVYLALSELRTRHAAVTAEAGEPSWTPDLSSFELRVFSQNGEDGVLAEILRRIGAPTRFFVEFGAEYGREGNCVYLADVARWQGLFLEAAEEPYRMLERKYAMDSGIRTIQTVVTPENIARLFAEGNVPPEPDVLSIDIDGQDYWVWSAIERYRPRVVVIEYNSVLDPRRRLVEPNEPGHVWEGTEYFGASLGALQALGERKGYRLVHTELSGVNAFFVREDLAGSAFLDPAEVAVRAPNYFQSGYRHPPADPGDVYLDLETNERVQAADAHLPRSA